MLRPHWDIQIPLKHRESSPPQLYKDQNRSKRRRIDPEKVDRNDVDQALAVIAAAPECGNEPPTLIPTELPHFKANYVQNWGKLHSSGCPCKRSPKKWVFGEDVTLRVNNGISDTILGGTITRLKCSKCQIFLCVEGGCWRHYHHSIGVNIDR